MKKSAAEIYEKLKTLSGYIDIKGYRVIYDPDFKKRNNKKRKGDTYEHRYVWENFHDCCLTDIGHVHHKNIDNLTEYENKHDNRIENLEGIMKSDHSRHHWMGNQLSKKDMTGRFCSICGSTTTYIKKDGWPQWFDDGKGGHICRKCHDKERWLKKKK